ncbi:MAG TPA: sulfur carrier protein ThiS [Thermomicrobiales bacterium]|nr:sulfur carrier protein ThiS [Thermomicrobiales bacterium]
MAQTTKLQLTLNGNQTAVDAGTTLGQLIDARGIERRMIAVEYNGEIVPRHEYDDIVLNDGDQMEVVQMVGGG